MGYTLRWVDSWAEARDLLVRGFVLVAWPAPGTNSGNRWLFQIPND